jgi:signal transduction histidine kinase
MAHGRRFLLWLLPGLGIAVLGGCWGSARQDELAWRAAEAEWQRHEPTAFAAWRRLDARGTHGREAHARLAEADVLYRRAIDRLRADQPGVRESLAEALALAPMDPAHYLPLARISRERGVLLRAADFYCKYLAQRPAPADAAAVRAEMVALAGKDIPWQPLCEEPREPSPAADKDRSWRFSYLAAVAGLLGLVGLMIWRRRRPSLTLRQIVHERPELHPTVAYQIGCLRHEFLKHRVGAAGDALQALLAGKASAEQRRFLEERFCKGEPLLAAWRAHVGSLERSLGLRGQLVRGDPLLRGAERALAVLARAATSKRPAVARRVEAAWAYLERLDRELASLVAGLAYCPIDEELLRDVLQSTRAEWASGKVELDEVVVGPVPRGVAVDVYGTDLRIVLKNIFRNAIAALGDSPRPRWLAVDVLLALEPTGEEVVRIRVRDTSSRRVAAPATTRTATSEVEHGLGIVRTALLRYDGSLELADGGDGYAKAVVVRLFRSQSTHDETLGEAA